MSNVAISFPWESRWCPNRVGKPVNRRSAQLFPQIPTGTPRGAQNSHVTWRFAPSGNSWDSHNIPTRHAVFPNGFPRDLAVCADGNRRDIQDSHECACRYYMHMGICRETLTANITARDDNRLRPVRFAGVFTYRDQCRCGGIARLTWARSQPTRRGWFFLDLATSAHKATPAHDGRGE